MVFIELISWFFAHLAAVLLLVLLIFLATFACGIEFLLVLSILI
jgi:hypothetical protein